MRDIKFRAWDKDKYKMISWDDLRDTYSLFLNTPNDWLYDCMQYTGLKDKNGREIYEEDIVEFSGYKRDRREVIEWVNIGHHTSFGAGTHNARVIGNIYENPELLTTSGE